ncbi:MAG: winged helix-turn-helix domain-containing protein [Alloacidobacterium sp.]|jgi:restriction endonuclease Mrr
MTQEMRAPSFDELMWGALVAMKALGGSATHEELLERVIELEHIPEAVQNIMHTERQTKLSYNLAWAKSWLKDAGALDNPSRGVWVITQKGLTLSWIKAGKLTPIRMVHSRVLIRRAEIEALLG